MAAAGYLYELTIDGTALSFKDVNIDDSAPPIDTSCRSNPDGSTNTGYSSKDADLQTLTITVDQHVETPNGLPAITKGVNEVSWSISYNGTSLYSGAAIYVERIAYSGSVPGEGRLQLVMYNHGPYS
jgi:hypothetical protein